MLSSSHHHSTGGKDRGVMEEPWTSSDDAEVAKLSLVGTPYIHVSLTHSHVIATERPDSVVRGRAESQQTMACHTLPPLTKAG